MRFRPIVYLVRTVQMFRRDGQPSFIAGRSIDAHQRRYLVPGVRLVRPMALSPQLSTENILPT